jgi:hypothetical protein
MQFDASLSSGGAGQAINISGGTRGKKVTGLQFERMALSPIRYEYSPLLALLIHGYFLF